MLLAITFGFLLLSQGVLAPQAAWAASGSGSALQLDGVDDYVRITDSPSLRPTQVTAEGWFMFSSPPAACCPTLMGKAFGDGFFDSYIVWIENGQLHGSVAGVGGQGPNVDYPFSPTLNTWYHIAYSYNGSTQTLYVNGVPVASTPNTTVIAYDSHPVLIGADFHFGSITFNFPGRIDEVRIWSVARSVQQIQENMGRRLDAQAGLVGAWHLDEGSGTTANDSSGNGNHGTLVNGPTWVTSTAPIDARESVDGKLQQVSAVGTYLPSDPRAPAGVYRIAFGFRNVSAQTYAALQATISQLSGGHSVVNRDGAPASTPTGVGAILTVPDAALGPDRNLSPNETFTVVIEVGLLRRESFSIRFTGTGFLVTNSASTQSTAALRGASTQTAVPHAGSAATFTGGGQFTPNAPTVPPPNCPPRSKRSTEQQAVLCGRPI